MKKAHERIKDMQIKQPFVACYTYLKRQKLEAGLSKLW